MSLGSWFVFGYEGFPREDRRRFFSQRDDPCESDDDALRPHARYDDDMRCIRRRRRLRKVRRPSRTGSAALTGPTTDGGEADAYDLVETSCSTSSASDGDVWGFHDDHEEATDQASTPRHVVGTADHLWYGGAQPTASWRAVELPVACIPMLPNVPPLFACSTALLFDASTEGSDGGALHGTAVRSVMFVHGGVNPRTPSLQRHPQSATYAIQVNRNAFLQTTWTSCLMANTAASSPRFVPRSLKRWTPSLQPPERFGHCSVAIPTACVPVHCASLLEEWNLGDALHGEDCQQRPSSEPTPHRGTTTNTPHTRLQAFMVFTFGGSGNGHVPLSLQRNRMSGFALSEPFLTLLIRRSGGTVADDGGGATAAGGSRRADNSAGEWWSSWRRLTPIAGAQYLSPRAFFSMCDYYDAAAHASAHTMHHSAPHAPLALHATTTEALPTFLLFGGTEDGAFPSGCTRSPVVVAVDTREWTVEARELATLGVPPESRFAHSMTWAGDATTGSGCYVLCGGIGIEGTVLSDVFLLDANTHVWREVVVPLTGIARSVATARAFHVAVRFDDGATGIERRQSTQVLFLGGEGDQGMLVPTACVYDVHLDTWRTAVCPLLASPIEGMTMGAAGGGGTSCSLRRQQAPSFLQSDPQKLVADTALRDALCVLQEQVTGTSSASSSFGSMCHGSAPCALPTRDAPTVLGGSNNYHGTSMSVTVFPVTQSSTAAHGGTLKEAVAMLILKHEVLCGLPTTKHLQPLAEDVHALGGGFIDAHRRDAEKVQAAELHARRYSAEALVKHWQSPHRAM